ncbi:MAG: 6-pyruvoyl-tetrahydropterin synthase-related protein, partial [Acidimicrobiia bacterium]
MAHLVRADFGISQIVAEARLDGWFPRFVLGHQEFLFNGPGLTWLMALVRAVTFGAVSNEAALKVVSVASFVALPPAVCFLARSFGLGRRASGLAAVLSVLVSTPFGIGLRGLFETGLVPHQVGAVFFCLALGAAVRTTEDDRGEWIVLLATSLAALAITHLISLLILGVMLVLTLSLSAATRGVSRSGFVRLALGCAGGAGLCGFWLVPFLAHRDLQGIVTTWHPPPLLDRLGSIATGKVLFPAGIAFLVVAAWTYQLVRARRRRDPTALVWVATPPAYLLVAHGVPHLVGLNEATVQLANRGLGYAGLLAILAVAGLLADGCRRFGWRGYAVALGLTAVAAVAAAPGRGSAGQFSIPVPAMAAAASELARLVPEGARFATERDYPAEIRRTGVVHPETWLARASGRNSLNGFNLESSSTPQAGDLMNDLDGLSATRLALRLNRYGVTHVVATSDDFVRRLTRSARFQPVWISPPLTILVLQPAPGSPPPASLVTAVGPASARLTRADAEHLGFEVEAPERTGVTLALAWSPKWQA